MDKFKFKMFKSACITALVIAIAATLFTGCDASSGSGKDKTFELELAHFFPASHAAETVFVKSWKEAIEEATRGKVKITSHPGGTLLGAKDIYEGVIMQSADIGMSCFSYTAGRFPVMEAFELPGIYYKNSKVASEVAWEGIRQLDPEELKDTHLLTVIACGPGDLFTKEPVRTLEDLQGKIIRGTGGNKETLERLGATFNGMGQGEVYEALQKGLLDGNLSPVEVLKEWKHAEVTNYLTRTPFLYNTLFFLTINLDVWNSIPEDLQDIITETTETIRKEVGIGLWDQLNEEALRFAVDEHRMQEITLSEDETARWMERIEPIQDEYKARLKSKGIEEDVLKVVKDLANKYNSIY